MAMLNQIKLFTLSYLPRIPFEQENENFRETYNAIENILENCREAKLL